MVLLDATDPNRSAGAGSAHAGPPSAIALVLSLARLGVGRLLPTSSRSALSEPAAGQVQAFARQPPGLAHHPRRDRPMPALLAQAGHTAPGCTPLVVLTAAGHGRDPRW